MSGMSCAGCDESLEAANVAAFAIMLDDRTWIGRPVCKPCHENPSHRVRTLKAHFALPGDVERMVSRAGASSIG